MRSHRLRHGRRIRRCGRGPSVSIGDFAVRIAAPAARPALDARGAARECVHRRARRAGARASHMPSQWHLDRSGRRVDHGHQLELESPAKLCPTTLRRSRTTGPPHRSPSRTAPRSTPSSSTSRHRPIRSPFRTGPPSRSPIRYRPVPRFCPPSRVNSGATLALGMALLPRSASLAGGGNVVVGPPIPPPPCYLGKQQHHVLRQTVGRGHARNRRRRSADADRPGKHDRR